LKLLPKAEETVDATGPYVSYGYGPGYKGVVSYMTINQKGVKLGIAGGASVPDPNNLLEGTGKSNRYSGDRFACRPPHTRAAVTRARGARRVEEARIVIVPIGIASAIPVPTGWAESHKAHSVNQGTATPLIVPQCRLTAR
jgi:hypothetical protein